MWQMSHICAREWLICLLFVIICVSVSVGHEWMAPTDAGKKPNPVAPGKNSIEAGKAVYREHCALRHGEDFAGMKSGQTGLEVDSPNLKKRLLTHTDGDFFWKIDTGNGEMPAFENVLSDEDKWHIINYIKDESR